MRTSPAGLWNGARAEQGPECVRLSTIWGRSGDTRKWRVARGWPSWFVRPLVLEIHGGILAQPALSSELCEDKAPACVVWARMCSVLS